VAVDCKRAIVEKGVPVSKGGRFDAEAFFQALDAQRQSRRLTWKQVAAESGVSASTLTRMAQGKRPDVDSLAALVTWSGVDADDFMTGGDEQRRGPEPLAMISTYLRSDRHLSPEAARALEAVIKAAYEQLREDDGPWGSGGGSRPKPTTSRARSGETSGSS
jgi:transcriptional regulator with XRE-family HTH domain